jgi:predicted O-methyltransferase YrrM
VCHTEAVTELVNHVLAGTAHVLHDRRAELALEQLYVDAQRAADEARGAGDPGDFGFGCSPAQGEFLYLWCRGTGARTAVQTAASAGATAIYLAAALRDNGGGTVLTADDRTDRVQAARRNLDAAGLAAFAEVRCGDPLDVLRDVAGPVDVLAIDGWPDVTPPSRALRVLQLLAPRLRPGALVLNDGREPDYVSYVRGAGSTLRTSLQDLGAISVVL